MQPTEASAAPRFAHPDVVCLPIADLPPSSTALLQFEEDVVQAIGDALDVLEAVRERFELFPHGDQVLRCAAVAGRTKPWEAHGDR